MTEVKKRKYRLFKVAREFNVSIDTIVEHLQKEGHEVVSNPNTSLPRDLYDVLLNEFASDKKVKQKAEEIIEKRREENRVINRTDADDGDDGGDKDGDSSHVSAEELRDYLKPKRRRRRPSSGSSSEDTESAKEVEPAKKEASKTSEPGADASKTTQKASTQKASTPESESSSDKESAGTAEVPSQKTAKQETAKAAEDKDAGKDKPSEEGAASEAESQKESSTDEPAVETPKIKGPTVVGKIDLDALEKGRRKTSKASGSSKQPANEDSPSTQKEAPTTKEPVAKAPSEEASSPKEKTTTSQPPSEEKQPEQDKRPAVAESDEAEADTKTQESTQPSTQPSVPTPELLASSEEATAEEEAPKPEEVMRAGDRTPSLPGLKVMGKIDLSSDKSKRKKSKDDKADSGQDTADKESASSDEGGDKKKRRRRRRKRKRKSSSSVEAGSQGQSGSGKSSGDSGRKRKEKVSQKEVDKSIRETYSQMNQAPSRQRQRLRRQRRDEEAKKREAQEKIQAEEAKVLQLTEFITANEFANLLDVPVNGIITKSFELGIMVSINQRLDAELLSLLAEEYGYSVEFVDVTDEEFEEEEIIDAPEDLEPRSPIITVMGHVDHGKTTLLDHLRKTNVTAEEAGGITQHIGAYRVSLSSGNEVTFLDTPGHEAFTAMRARGAKVTDVVIIVIAADDAVMPQTKEAINHAQAADVPMVFAINKVDKPGADPERIKGQLAEMNIVVEDWGGKYQSQEISALKGLNVDELLEKVILEADLLELKANPNRSSTGTVIESRLDKGRGNVATILVQNGTLTVGDEMVAGIHYGKVRALINQNGERVDEAGPSTPVQVLGLAGQPQAGDKFQVFTEDGKARDISQRRSELYREQQFRQTKHITLDEITRRRAIGNFKELNIIIRGDVDGSVEALAGSLLKLSTDEVQVNILLKGVGAITENDVLLASASDAVIIAFNVRPNAAARQLSEREGIEMRTYSVIYDAINDVKDALEGLLSPEIKEEIIGTAEVHEVFKITKVGAVAGCLATSGKIIRDEPVRIIRDGVVIYDSKFASLKRFKDDVKEVINGLEFGAQIKNYNDVKVGDVLESYRINEVRRKL